MISSSIPANTIINRAKVELYNGSTLVENCTCSDRISNFDIERVGESGKFFGFGIIHKLNIQLIDLNRDLDIAKGYKIKVAVGDVTGRYDYPYPTFYVSDVLRNETDNSLSVVAYDKLHDSTLHMINELGLVSTRPYTISEYVTTAANYIGISDINLNGYAEFNLSYENGANFDTDAEGNIVSTVTIRNLFTYASEATQTIYYLDSSDSLIFRRLSGSSAVDYNISKEEYFTLETGTALVLEGICNVTELGDNVQAGTGNIQYVRENPFWNLRADINTLVDNALANVTGLSINPFVCQEWNGNHRLEIGDKITLELEDGSKVTSYLLDDVISFGGVLAETTQWSDEAQKDETESNSTSITEVVNKTFAKVDKVNKEITLLATETETKIEDLTETVNTRVSEINVTLEGINQKVTNVETVNSEQTTKIGQLEVKDDEITAKVSSVESTANGNASAISALQINANNISASVSSLQSNTQAQIESLDNSIEAIHQEASLKMTSDQVNIAIESALDNGVDKVVTSLKNYKFDDHGLNISSSDSVVNTTITEDGMIIEKEGVDVLTATNTGVNAIDLHATTFLRIGNNTYFSDWQGNRVGCFWNS